MIGPSSARITRTMKMPSSIGKKKLHALKKYYQFPLNTILGSRLDMFFNDESVTFSVWGALNQ